MMEFLCAYILWYPLRINTILYLSLVLTFFNVYYRYMIEGKELEFYMKKL
jgi:hypothetical protein